MHLDTQNVFRGWQSEELGQPLPASPHAVSVALPRWQDVVAYEEKNPEVLKRLKTGYPRFVTHPLVERAARQLSHGQPCLPLPSQRVAQRAADFVQSNGAKAQIVERQGAFGVVTSDEGMPALRSFWQHTGLIVSSRQAEAQLNGSKTGPDDGTEVCRSLRSQLAGLYDCAADDIILEPTGMAAVFAALHALVRRTPGKRTVQLGFPYVDTLKLQQKFGAGAVLLHDLASVPATLGSLLEREQLAGCFCEIPGNPLLGSPDLRKVGPLLRERGVPLVADDVVATAVNVDLGNYADLIATSLTKFFVGTGDVMGGALICNPRSPFYRELKPLVLANHEELLWPADAAVLERHGRDFPPRMKLHNENGLWLAEQFRRHPAVERVWYPKWETNEAYEAVMRPGGGWGALLTFLPRKPEALAARIYDQLAISKGPSLGTVFTLACPFTLLAHYTELDWAESCGVSRYLIRMSVGLEDREEIWRRVKKALEV
jgi:cystathionine gamma-synthase